MKHKNEARQKFIESKTLVENQTWKKINSLWADNGLEFVDKEFT